MFFFIRLDQRVGAGCGLFALKMEDFRHVKSASGLSSLPKWPKITDKYVKYCFETKFGDAVKMEEDIQEILKSGELSHLPTIEQKRLKYCIKTNLRVHEFCTISESQDDVRYHSSVKLQQEEGGTILGTQVILKAKRRDTGERFATHIFRITDKKGYLMLKNFFKKLEETPAGVTG